MTKTVLLVNAGNDPAMASLPNDNTFPALGVLHLGTYLKQERPDLEVICRDGGATSQQSIEDDIRTYKPQVVGVSVLATSYQNALSTAKMAKEVDATVIFGNDQASQLSQEIITHQKSVDYVVGHEYGEKPLVRTIDAILNGEPARGIPSLTWRNPDGTAGGFEFTEETKKLLSIISQDGGYGGRRWGGLDQFPIPDRTLYPESHWKSFLENYLEKYAQIHETPVTGVATMNRARGCNRQKEDQCTHCDMLLDVSYSSPDLFWQDAKSAFEQVGANVLYEVCDSFTSFRKFISEVAKSKPDDLGFDPMFYVYGQAVDVAGNNSLIEQLTHIGVYRMNMGLESGCDITLKDMKGLKDSVETNVQALQDLKEAGIKVYGSFVIGGSQLETPETLRETTEFAKYILREGLVMDIEAQPILPLRNNMQGRWLKNNGLWITKETQPDWPDDIDTLSEVYINNATGITHEHAIEAVNEIRDAAKEHRIHFGSGVSSKSQYRQ